MDKPRLYLDYQGQELTVSQASKLTGIPSSTLRKRFASGLRGDELFKPPIHRELTEYDGQLLTLNQLSKKVSIGIKTLTKRYDSGQRDKDLYRPYGTPSDSSSTMKTEYEGELLSLQQISRLSGVSKSTVAKRYREGSRGIELTRKRYADNQILIEYKGDNLTFTELSKVTGTARTTLVGRYKRGYRGTHIINIPSDAKGKRKKKPGRRAEKILHKGSLITFKQLSEVSGMYQTTLRLRYARGLRDEELVATPAQNSYKEVEKPSNFPGIPLACGIDIPTLI